MLFEADQRGLDPLDLLAARRADPHAVLPEHAVALVEGVTARRAELDELISTYTQGWPLDRMPAVDRCLIRLGAWELLYCDDVPPAVAIDEAVRLAAELSTDESPAFVNGLLARLLEVGRAS